MARMYDRPTLGPDGWVVDETPTPPLPNVTAITDPVTGGIRLLAGTASISPASADDMSGLTPKQKSGLSDSETSLVSDWSSGVFSSSPAAAPAFGIFPPDDTGSACYTSANLIGNAADGVYCEMMGLGVNSTSFTGATIWARGPSRSADYITDMCPLKLYFGVGGYGKYALAYVSVPSDGAWHKLYVPKTQFLTGGGFVWGDTIDRVRIRVADAADISGLGMTRLSAGENLYIGSVSANLKTLPKFLIRFDDGISDLVMQNPAVNQTLPDGTPAPAGGWSGKLLLDHYGFKGNVFLLTRRIGTSNSSKTFLTWAQIRDLADAGWGICLQSHSDPVDAVNSGMSLLGPVGYAARGVSSVDTSGNTIICAVGHNISQGATYWGYPIVFSGSALPSPLVVNKVYWARAIDSTTFGLYLTETDSISGINAIDLTTTGTPANFTYSYAGSTNDHSAIQRDFEAGISLLERHGHWRTARVVAVNQGNWNAYVAKGARAAGINVILGALYNTIGKAHVPSQYPSAETSGSFPLPPMIPNIASVGGIQTDAAGVTQSDVEGFVASAVSSGGLSQNFHHSLTNPNVNTLAILLGELKRAESTGSMQVVVAQDVF